MDLTKEYNFKDSEKKWQEFWLKEGIYKFKAKKSQKVFSVDTPPPTVSGKMHIGHASSYSQQDFIVRYHRMKGEAVFYPFGTDDNGLPTEKLVEKLKNVRSTHMQRAEFVKLCDETLKEIKPDFIQDWKNIGMSCDFSSSYSTIDKHCIKTSQLSFLDLYKKELVYQQDSPSMWCVSCQTAIAQAELEDKQLDSTFNDIAFSLEDGNKIIIATTRPELLAACVCIYVNPNDEKNKHLIGKKAYVPIFGQSVSIFGDESADPNKGSGILMICSYGDKFDVEAVKKRKLEARTVFTKDGKLNDLAEKYKGLSIKEARKEILKDLEDRNLLLAKKPIKHAVNVHERCGTEIEFLSTKQWFVKIIENKEKLVKAGEAVKWYPQSMFLRFKHWVEGTQWDWCISRQRHFGVAFPVWYCKKCGNVHVASEEELPIDPLVKKPKHPCKCGSKEFTGEKDVMDTWATSSVSPQIVCNWIKDKKFGYKTNIEIYPMTLRPQAHDIIRTWAFYTIIKGIYHFNKIPWHNIVISGHVLDAKGEAMHKSKGNTIEPKLVLDKYPADAFRFWTSSNKLGDDIRYMEKDLQAGAKTVNKLWNASKFSLQHIENFNHKKKVKLELMDQWLLAKLNNVIKECTDGFEEYEYSKAKTAIDNFFWKDFCDNYLEIIKDRIYNPDKRGEVGKASAQYTLYVTLLTIIKLYAPIMPHITEEIYQMFYLGKEKEKSIHISKWPKTFKIKNSEKLVSIGDKFVEVLIMVRQEKSKAGKSLKEPVKLITCSKELSKVIDDLKAVTHALEVKFGADLKVEL